MHLRAYRPSDLSTITDILALNNHTDSLARFFTRDIERYPTTYRQGCLRFLKGLLLGTGTICFVAETDQEDNACEKLNVHHSDSESEPVFKGSEVVGFCIWQRHGTTSKAKEWQRKVNGSWFDALNRGLMNVEGKYHKTWPWTLNEHTLNHAHFNAITPILFQPFDQDVFSEAWEILVFNTHVSWQRRGIGTLLMEWGKEQANEEGVPVIVSGSPKGGLAYRRMGFEEVGELGLGLAGGFDELEFGGEVMRRWCWEPNEEGRWVERARENRRKRKQQEKEKEGA